MPDGDYIPLPRLDPRRLLATSQPFGSLAPAMPRTDPRGSTFIDRLPKVSADEMQPFGAGEIPTAALMRALGYAIKPDRNVIKPEQPMSMADPVYRGYIQRDI